MIQNALGLIEVIGLPTAIEAADAALKAANVKLIAIANADAGILTVEITGDVGAVHAAVKAGAAAAERIGQVRASHMIPRVEQSLAGVVLYHEKKPLFAKKGRKKASKIKEETRYQLESPNETQNQTANGFQPEKTTLKTTSKTNPTEHFDLPAEISDSMDFVDDEKLPENENISLDEPMISSSEKENEMIPDQKRIYKVEELKKMSNSSLRTLIEQKQKEGKAGTLYQEVEQKNLRKQDLIRIIEKLQTQGEGED